MSHSDFTGSPYLTPEEGQTIKEFMAETGLYGIERFPVTVEQGFADERTGILLKYTFYNTDEKNTCAIASLSTPEDEAIEAHMLYLHYEQIAKIIDMEMQTLGNGWYFFIYGSKKDDPTIVSICLSQKVSQANISITPSHPVLAYAFSTIRLSVWPQSSATIVEGGPFS